MRRRVREERGEERMGDISFNEEEARFSFQTHYDKL
jgi:hypothetical protein